jgi:hypothetical protein
MSSVSAVHRRCAQSIHSSIFCSISWRVMALHITGPDFETTAALYRGLPPLLSPLVFAIFAPTMATREHQARETFKCRNRFVRSVPASMLNEPVESALNNCWSEHEPADYHSL